MGCAQPSKVIDRVIVKLPPAELLQACPAPVGKAATNEDIAEWLLEYKGVLRGCDADKTSLRQWAEEAGKDGAAIGAK